MVKKIAGSCTLRTMASKNTDQIIIKMSTEKSIAGIYCNSQSVNTAPSLFSI